MGSPSTQTRSVASTRWGEVVQPTTKPAAFSMWARKAPVLPLLLVPAMRMTGKAASGRPRPSSRAWMFSRPHLIPMCPRA